MATGNQTVRSDLRIRFHELICSRHCTGFSNTTIYHSYGRAGNPRVLADSDIVLSTYHTIAAESTDKASPLWQINWFRVVLDEGKTLSPTLPPKTNQVSAQHTLSDAQPQSFSKQLKGFAQPSDGV